MLMHTHPHANETAAETTGSVIRWGSFYDTFVRIAMLGRDKALREMTIDLAGVKSGDRVLEVGCGTGAVALAAKRRAGSTGDVHGIDPSPEMIAAARRKAHHAHAEVDFRLGVVESLPFPDGSFDVVLSSLMMHHLPTDLKRPALAEIRRVLKPGGQLLVVDFKRPTSLLGRAAATMLLHGAMKEGVQDLVPAMQAAGFASVETGGTRFGMLGYARARVENSRLIQ